MLKCMKLSVVDRALGDSGTGSSRNTLQTPRDSLLRHPATSNASPRFISVCIGTQAAQSAERRPSASQVSRSMGSTRLGASVCVGGVWAGGCVAPLAPPHAPPRGAARTPPRATLRATYHTYVTSRISWACRLARRPGRETSSSASGEISSATPRVSLCARPRASPRSLHRSSPECASRRATSCACSRFLADRLDTTPPATPRTASRHR